MNSMVRGSEMSGGGFQGDSSVNREMMESLTRALLQTRGFREALAAAAPELVNAWAGRNPLKRVMGASVKRSIRKSFDPDDSEGTDPLGRLCENPEFAEKAGCGLPGIANAFLSALSRVMETLAGAAPDKQREIVNSLAGGVDLGNLGAMITSLAKILSAVHREEPEFFTRTLRPAVRSLIESTDFGEIKESFDLAAEDLAAFAGMVNEELWEYPAKVVCLLSLLPNIINAGLRSVVQTTRPLNALAPDLLTDVVMSLLRELRGENIGALVNELSELVRKIGTGSVLLGEQGRPVFPEEMARLSKEVLAAVDVKLLLKARSYLGEVREMAMINFIRLMEQSPELAREFFHSHFQAVVTFVRNWSHRADAFESLFSTEDVAREFARGMGEIDAQELAATVNRMCAIFNDVRKITPGIIKNTLSQVFASLDEYEAAETARWLTEDVVESFKPIAPEVLPPVIRGLADLLRPGKNGNSEEMREALAYFRDAVRGEENVTEAAG